MSVFGILLVDVEFLKPFANKPTSARGGGSDVGIGGGIVVEPQMLLFKKFNGLLLKEPEVPKKLPKLIG